MREGIFSEEFLERQKENILKIDDAKALEKLAITTGRILRRLNGFYKFLVTRIEELEAKDSKEPEWPRKGA